jgi:hypothetical protein
MTGPEGEREGKKQNYLILYPFSFSVKTKCMTTGRNRHGRMWHNESQLMEQSCFSANTCQINTPAPRSPILNLDNNKCSSTPVADPQKMSKPQLAAYHHHVCAPFKKLQYKSRFCLSSNASLLTSFWTDFMKHFHTWLTHAVLSMRSVKLLDYY